MESGRILIVEDENIVALSIRKVIEANGYSTAGVCSSGEAVIEQFPSINPDLVLMDILLSGEMDGIECAEQLRASYKIPIILLTAYADKQTLDRAKHIDPFGYIVKPFTDRDLVLTVELALYREKMEKALRISEKRYRRFFANDLSGNFVTDGEGLILECNTAFIRLLHLGDTEQVIGRNISTYFRDSAQWDYFQKAIQMRKAIEPTELDLQTGVDAYSRVLGNVVGVFDGDELSGMQGYFIDITEKIHLEEQLRQAQKMEAVGRLAGGIAHDFNNILTVVLGYTSLLEEKTAGTAPASHEIQGIRTAALKASELTRQLLTFSRRSDLKAETINLHHLITNIEHMLQRLMSRNIRIHLHLRASRSIVQVDPGQFEQVLMNLAVNASDAMPAGGRIIISTENTDNLLLLYFKDTGMGIAENIRANIFEPFFTTKADTVGTGLGLSTVYGIIRQSGGSIDVSSKEGEGTTFCISLPLSEAEVPSIEKTSAEDSDISGTETIVAVIEDTTLNELFTRILTGAGYTVVSAGNAGEALLMCEREDVAADLLITENIMRHMNGAELASRLTVLSPEMKVLYVCGEADGSKSELQDGMTDKNVLMKPFQPSQLLSCVRALLDEPAGTLLS